MKLEFWNLIDLSDKEIDQQFPGASYRLTSNLGMGLSVVQIKVEEKEIYLLKNDLIILATDGLWDNNYDDDLEFWLNKTSEPKELCQYALDSNSKDNITVMAIRYE